MLKLTVIGCWGSYPKANGASAGYLLQSNNFTLLIDCGSGVLAKLQNIIDVQHIDAVIISHYHADHIADIGVLQHARLVQSILHNSSETLPIYGHTRNMLEFDKLTYKQITTGIEYAPDEQLELGPFLITFQRTNHSVDCYAMRITSNNKTVVYTADTAYQKDLIYFSSNADLLISECSFYGNQHFPESGHMNSYEVGKISASANVKKVLLTHLPHFGTLDNLITEVNELYNGEVLLAEYGKVLTI